jgi:hypothetical protein
LTHLWIATVIVEAQEGHLRSLLRTSSFDGVVLIGIGSVVLVEVVLELVVIPVEPAVIVLNAVELAVFVGPVEDVENFEMTLQFLDSGDAVEHVGRLAELG